MNKRSSPISSPVQKVSCLLMLLLLSSLLHAKKTNVVLIYADDLGWGDLRIHNQRPEHFRYTPNIDRLFKKGIELNNYMTHPVCSPSRAGLLTGKHYARVDAGPRTEGTLSSKYPNIAKDFKKAGYATGAFGKWHNSNPNQPEDGNFRIANFNKDTKFNALHQAKTLNVDDNVFEKHKEWIWGEGVNAYGFDRFVGFYTGGGDHFNHYVDTHHDADWWHDRHYRADDRGYRTHQITDYAIEFIEQNKDKPFFCYVPQEAVHHPIQLPLAELKDFCAKLDTELGIKGQWEYVSRIKSPVSGKSIADVEQLRFGKKQEFDLHVIDPKKKHFAHLIFAAYIYTLDQSVGRIMDKLEALDLLDNTIVAFASDNGGIPEGVNLPFKGGKHSVWEGGIHVPAALYWKGHIESSNPNYKNKQGYDGMVAYYDLYPTLMELTGESISAEVLDGLSFAKPLMKRSECRPDPIKDAVHWMWINEGMSRTNKWKMIMSPANKKLQLYNLEKDPAETQNVAQQYPEIAALLQKQYTDWLQKAGYTASWIAPIVDKVFADPEPKGDVLEVLVDQDSAIKNPSNDGVFVRFSSGGKWSQSYDDQIHTSDVVSFDIMFSKSSQHPKGVYYSPGMGWDAFYRHSNGLTQNGKPIRNCNYKKGQWYRQTIGVGNLAPGIIPVNHLVIGYPAPGKIKVYLDNIVIRKKDGSLRKNIWSSKGDDINLIYRYKKTNYPNWAKAKQAKGFPLKSFQLEAVDLNQVK